DRTCGMGAVGGALRVPAREPRSQERPLRSIAYVVPAQIRSKRRMGSAQTNELGHGRPGELRNPMRGLPKASPAGAGALRGRSYQQAQLVGRETYSQKKRSK